MGAAIRANLTLYGERDTRRLLAELPKRVGRKGLRAAVSAGGTVVQKAARARVPTGPRKLLKKSLKKKVKTYQSGNSAAIIGASRDVVGEAGVDLGRGKNARVRKHRRAVPANYIHLVEKGHGGPAPAPAHPFLEPAYRASEPQALAVTEAKLNETVHREAAKLASKGRRK